jgi:hypothetical protein
LALSTLALPFYQPQANKIEALVTNKGYKIQVNRVARCLEGNMGYYSGEESVTVSEIC